MTAINNFKGFTTDLDAPANSAISIIPSDASDLTNCTRALYVGVGGDIKVTMLGGNVVTFTAVPQGVMLPIRVIRVWAAGTSASGIIGVW